MIIETLKVHDDINTKKCERVKISIDSYLSSSKHRTLRSLSEDANIPYSTVRRIHSLDGNPKPEAIIKIFNTIGNDKALFDYMKDFHPEIAGVMAKNQSHNKEYTYISETTKSYYTDERYFLILNLASTSSGTTEEEVIHTLGTLGLERLNHLQEEGLIIKDVEGRYFGANTNYKLSLTDTKSRIALSMKHYRIEEAGSNNNWLSFQTESLNDEGLRAMKKLSQKHFNERKDQIYNNPMYQGKIKHYSACISSTFLPYAKDGGIQ